MQPVNGLASVILPFYNSEQFLSEAIESVLAQTYSHLELLLVDDGATDHSTEIARDYVAQFPQKIRYIQHEGHRNFGVTRTRNLGASEARGEYLAFLDSDDVWLSNKLEHQIGLMDDNPDAGLVYGPSEYWYDWDAAGSPIQSNHVPAVAPGGKLYSPPDLLIHSYPFGAYGAPCPSSFLLRRSAFDRVGGFIESFNPGSHQLYEDTAFLTSIYLKVPVFVSSIHLDRYRCHPLSIWHRTKRTTREEEERRYYFQWLRDYLHKESIVDPAILKPIRRIAWPYWLPLPSRVTQLIRRIGNRLPRRP